MFLCSEYAIKLGVRALNVIGGLANSDSGKNKVSVEHTWSKRFSSKKISTKEIREQI